ncbi:DUF4260 family protein [Demequina aestuarii]|uniref:DUF4260 family protein n=1 Tax=Demequina aestuarii TaxID=327095 RepID=UPI000781EB7E|nr:DUF4260 family protein [Demequina aestuarii]
MTPVTWQRLEGAALALAALAAAAMLDGWWWPLALFLVFDLSALGYVAGTRIGAATYNAGHALVGPSVMAGWALASGGFGVPGGRVAALVAAAWAFHVGVDRALGYGLKHADSFQHTHLGWIGRSRTGE